MKYKEVKTIDYHYGEEKKIEQLLYDSDEPIVLRINEFPDTFDLDYFIQSHESNSTFYRYKNGKEAEFAHDKFTEILKKIKEDQPIRIFGEGVNAKLDQEIQQKIPLWDTIPFRPRYYAESGSKVLYFFGGNGSNTAIHYDRELNSNLHICLHGKKKVLLFTVDESRNIYKVPYVSDSLVDFSQPFTEARREQFSNLENALCYEVILNPGEMLYMPKCCWHYVEYLEHNASATFAFYPKKSDQFWGMLNGMFYLGFSRQTLALNTSKLYWKFAYHFATAKGLKRFLLKGIELVSFALLFPICSISFWIKKRFIGGRLY